MSMLYGCFILMLLLALALLGIANISRRNFLIVSFCMVVFAFISYRFSGDHAELEQWFAVGKQHYQLQQEVNALGGVDGMIARVKERLKVHPEDAEGQLILKKLESLQSIRDSHS